MRKTAAALAILMAVSAAGILLAGVGISPMLAATAGVLAVGAAAAARVPTDRLLWASTCLFVLTITWNGIRVGGGAFGNMFLALAVVSLIAHVLVTRNALPLPPALLLVGLGLLLAQTLSLVFPPNVALTNKSEIQFLSLFLTPVYLPPRSDIAELLKFEVSIVLVPVLMMTAAVTARRCGRLLDLFAISAVVSALVATLDYHGFGLGPIPLQVDRRAAGLAIHPNYLALGATMAIPLVMLWFARADVRWRLAGLAAVPILLLGVMASGSRAGAVTAAVAVVVPVVIVPRLRGNLSIALPVLGMVAVVALTSTSLGRQVLEQVRLSGGSNTAGSDFQRAYAGQVAHEQIQARPLQGVGFSVIADAHNIYLELLAAGGVIALSAFAVFCGSLAAATRRVLAGPHRDTVAVAALSTVLWLISGVVGNEVADKFLYVVPGVILALARVEGRRRRPAAPAPAPVAAALSAPAARPRVSLPA